MKSKKKAHGDRKKHRHQEKHKDKRRHRRPSSSSDSSASLSRSPVRKKIRGRKPDSSASTTQREISPPPRVFPPSPRSYGRDARANCAYALDDRSRRRTRRRSSCENEVVSFTYSRPTVDAASSEAAEADHTRTLRSSSVVAKVAAATLKNRSPATREERGAPEQLIPSERLAHGSSENRRKAHVGVRDGFSGDKSLGKPDRPGIEDSSALAASSYELKTYHKAFGLDVGGYAFVGEEESFPLSDSRREEDRRPLEAAVAAGAAASLLHGSLVEVKGTERPRRFEKRTSKTHPHLFWQCWSCGADNYKTRHQCFKCNRLFAA
ncbi:conserved hypothetical protein [Neospora caninum Liverpool]|uniref:RanBP2-type domain-containing protein n=1 Tax=Neospora caninum (strain Liverpool) TaxID=572307 RepID=F0VRB2_NEOCL|nr:conserved hypothetical protein [Neospora caninum Liverpool]CBZ56260.1 conserved hypothetical protein [Neospora caninum Liverpool]CEL71022.1 TPA: hypothetical protein BN1204_066850 [Neospora caninum Liverpool]|eukprot:XP_003886285.1 conserved hypothetical protein [Neospora caninum Liverpool]